MDKYFAHNGEFINMTEKNKIGSGGYGAVYSGMWHNEIAAFKCVGLVLPIQNGIILKLWTISKKISKNIEPIFQARDQVLLYRLVLFVSKFKFEIRMGVGKHKITIYMFIRFSI